MLLVGCQFDPYANDFTIQKPKFNNVIGVYKFDQQTIGSDSITNKAKYGSITLNADSTFEAVNVPNAVNDAFGGMVTSKGKWRIEIIGGVDNNGVAQNNWGVILTDMPTPLQYIGFMNEKPPYKLIITYSDPDEGAVAIYKKQ